MDRTGSLQDYGVDLSVSVGEIEGIERGGVGSKGEIPHQAEGGRGVSGFRGGENDFVELRESREKLGDANETRGGQ
jgi:hypothetical protein